MAYQGTLTTKANSQYKQKKTLQHNDQTRGTVSE